MSYRYELSEPVGDGARRIAREQIQKALGELDDRGMGLHDRVHQVRKRCKKVRAVARLVRPALGSRYAGINAHFRDAARALSDLRDAHALVEGFDDVTAAWADEWGATDLASVRAAFVTRRDRLTADQDVEGLFASTRDAFREHTADHSTWRMRAEGPGAWSGGLERVYRRGRHAMRAARAQPTAENHHEWRKRAKYLWYHARLLRHSWTGPLSALESELDRLGDVLGDDHDVAVVRETVSRESELAKVRGMDTYLDRLGRRSNALRAEAHDIGRRVYAEKPARFVTRLARYAEVADCPA